MTSEELQLYKLAQIAQKKAIVKRRRRTALSPKNRPGCREIERSPTQRLGAGAEEQALLYLESAGLIVIGRNLRGKTGEIDLVCRDHDILAFVEVRRRRSSYYGGAAASVNRAKQQRLIKTASYFLPVLTRRYFSGVTPACRFDVITVEPAGLFWFKHAFAMA